MAPRVFALLAVATGALANNIWDYTNQDTWKDAAVGNNQCGLAGWQSPINLVRKTATASFSSGGTNGAVLFSDEKGALVQLRTNSHTWEVVYSKEAGKAQPSVQWGGKWWYLQQFHFHSPSEHTIDGKYAAMEMQMVHKGAGAPGEVYLSPDQWLVVAVLMDVVKAATPGGDDGAHEFLAEFWPPAVPSFPAVPSQMPSTKLAAPYRKMVPSLGHADGFLQYIGSETTPPCTNNTAWLVMLHRAKISEQQFNAYRTAINAVPSNQLATLPANTTPMGIDATLWNSALGVNNRLVQPIATRVVYWYHPGFWETVVAFFVVGGIFMFACVCCPACACLCLCISGVCFLRHIEKTKKEKPNTRGIEVVPKKVPVRQPVMVYQPVMQQVQMVPQTYAAPATYAAVPYAQQPFLQQ